MATRVVLLSGQQRGPRRVRLVRICIAVMTAAAGIRPKDDQGTYDRSENLTVSFDPAKIDALLTSLGAPPWTGPRPVLIPVLAVHGRKPPRYTLTAAQRLAAGQRAAFERIADEAGITLRWPTSAELQDFRKAGQPPCGPDATIVVTGRLEWSETAPGWIGLWHSCWHGQQHAWRRYGGGYDQAFANLVDGVTLLASGRGAPETLPAADR